MSKPKTILIVTGVTLIWGALLAFWLLNNQQPTTPQPVVSRPSLNELATLVNKDRTDAGLAPLTRDPDLDASATDKCNDMVAKHYWEHVAPDGTSWTTFINAHQRSKYIGENLSARGLSASEVNTGWLGSPEHRANILDPDYDDVGYAICDVNATIGEHAGNYKNVIVQAFSGN